MWHCFTQRVSFVDEVINRLNIHIVPVALVIPLTIWLYTFSFVPLVHYFDWLLNIGAIFLFKSFLFSSQSIALENGEHHDVFPAWNIFDELWEVNPMLYICFFFILNDLLFGNNSYSISVYIDGLAWEVEKYSCGALGSWYLSSNFYILHRVHERVKTRISQHLDILLWEL